MAYINKKEYQKLIDYAPKGADKSSITQALISKGHIIQGINDQEQKSFGGQLVKDIASPFIKGGDILRTGAPVLGAVFSGLPAAIGLGDKEKARERIVSATEKAQAKQKQQISTVFGEYNPVTSLKEATGTALEGASTLIGGGAVKSLATTGLRGLLGAAIKRGAQTGLVSGTGFGVGRGMADDETTGQIAQQGLLSGVAGGLGGGVLGGAIVGGSLASKAIARKVSQKLQPIEEQTIQKITDYVGKAIKPSTAGKTPNQMKKIQRKQVEAFQILKNNVNDIKIQNEFGGFESRTPSTVRELVGAVQDVKTKLFSRYDKLARQAGERGADFNPIKTTGELEKLVGDKSYSPSLRKYASDVLEEIVELKGESPVVIQSRIKELNESLAGYFAGRVEKGRARIDASVARLLNEELDDVIFNFTSGNWSGLRSQFSALKTLEKDATRAAQRIMNRQAKGLGDLTDIFTGGDLVSGILTANPAAATRGLLGKSIQMYYKYLNNPDRYIRKIFEELGETQPNIRKSIIETDPSKLLTSPSSIPLKPKSDTSRLLSQKEASERIVSKLDTLKKGSPEWIAEMEKRGLKPGFAKVPFTGKKLLKSNKIDDATRDWIMESTKKLPISKLTEREKNIIKFVKDRIEKGKDTRDDIKDLYNVVTKYIKDK